MDRKYPIPVEALVSCLRELGVREGDSLLTHTAFRSLYYGWPEEAEWSLSDHYGRNVIRGLKDLVGSEGILMMPSEFLPDYQMASFRGTTFDLRHQRTNRGFLPQLFLEFSDVKRSTNPIYNCAVWGPRSFEPFLENHHQFAYSMDVGSPWHELMKRNGKVAYLGASLDSNSMIHMPEYILKQDYPRPVFFGRPHHYNLIDTAGRSIEADAYVHAIRWGSYVVTKFCNYLNSRYGILKHGTVGDTSIVVVDAQAQYDALMSELNQGVSWYDATTWD
nr:AAC(3) family N-acetyltransferase [Microvirga puerhi]